MAFLIGLHRRELTLLKSRLSGGDEFLVVQAKDYRFVVAALHLGGCF